MKERLDKTKKQISPARKYWRFLPFESPEEILDFGLKETPLIKAENLAKWLGVKKCFLKLETFHPTGTMKDRITELVYSIFLKHGIKHYSHSSTGNTATSFVWGFNKLKQKFILNLFVPEKQLSHYNFDKISGVTVNLLKEANYDQGRKYNSWYAKHNLKDPNLPKFSGEFRQKANKLMYIEAYDQLRPLGVNPDFVCQTIGRGAGLIGAYLSAKDALEMGWFKKIPGMVAVQPAVADPITRCYNSKEKTYSEKFIINNLKDSKAFAIRRGDASDCYDSIRKILDESGGFAVSAEEKNIIEAKEKLFELENIDAGFTACTAIAGIKKRVQENKSLKDKTFLIMITGADRSEMVIAPIDNVIEKEEWQKAINEN